MMLLGDTNYKKSWPHVPISWDSPMNSPAWFLCCHLIPKTRLAKSHWLNPKHKVCRTRTITLVRQVFHNTSPSVLLKEANLAVCSPIYFSRRSIR